MKRRMLGLSVPLVLLVSGCSSSTPSYSLTVTVSFETRIDGNGSTIPKKNGGIFLCEPSGFTDNSQTSTSTPPDLSIMDESWNGTDLEIFNSMDNLIGVADSATPSILPDGSCQVQFLYSKLNLPNEPIKLKTPAYSEWDIPQSQWTTGIVSLNGMSSKF